MSVEAEMSVLGCMMLNEDFSKFAVDALTPEMFTHNTTRRIFEAATDQYWAGLPLDGVTLIERLPDDRKTLLKLADYVPTARHGPEYLQIVRDEWRRRTIQEALSDIAIEAPECTSEEIIERLREFVAEQDGITRAQSGRRNIFFGGS